MALEWEISDEARRIFRDSDYLWELQLIAQVIVDRRDEGEGNIDLVDHGLGVNCITLMEFPEWGRVQLAENSELIERLAALVNDIASIIGSDTRDDARVNMIVTQAVAISNCQREAWAFCRRVHATPVDSRCVRARRELIAFANSIVEDVDEFAYLMFAQVQEIRDLPASERHGFHLTFNLKGPNINALTHELESLNEETHRELRENMASSKNGLLSASQNWDGRPILDARRAAVNREAGQPLQPKTLNAKRIEMRKWNTAQLVFNIIADLSGTIPNQLVIAMHENGARVHKLHTEMPAEASTRYEDSMSLVDITTVFESDTVRALLFKKTGDYFELTETGNKYAKWLVKNKFKAEYFSCEFASWGKPSAH